MNRVVSVILSCAVVLSLMLTAAPAYAADESPIPAKTGFQAMRDSLQLTWNDEFDGT